MTQTPRTALALPVRNPDTAMQILQTYQGEIEQAILKESALTFAVVAESAMAILRDTSNQKSHAALMSCTGDSIKQAIVDAASLGFSFHKTLGLAYMVPFSGKVTLMIGYRGLLDLIQRATETQRADAQLIYQEDNVVRFTQGSEPDIVVEPCLTADRRPEHIVGAYFVAVLKNGQKQIEYMTKAEIDGIRARSKMGNFGAWVTDYGQMARKTVIRRGVNQLPKSINRNSLVLAKALEIEDRQTGKVEHGQADAPGKSEALRRKLAGDVIDTTATTAPEQATLPREPLMPQEAPFGQTPIKATADERAGFSAVVKGLRANNGGGLSDADWLKIVKAVVFPGETWTGTKAEFDMLANHLGDFDAATGEIIPSAPPATTDLPF